MENGNKIRTVLVDGFINNQLIAKTVSICTNDADSGAQTVFLGRVRADEVDGKTVKAIEYSAYPEMVEQEAERIVNLILKKYNQVTNLIIKHGTGKISAGEVSLLIVVWAHHRKQAFQAIEETVELIKEHLPVWKKEILDDGSYLWTENKK